MKKVKLVFSWVLVATLFVPVLISAAEKKLGVKDQFPPFILKKLGTSEVATLDQFKGKVLIVDFWASWCGPCKLELPVLNTLYKKYQSKGLVVLGVSVDDEAAPAQEFIKKNPLDFPILHDEQKKLADLCHLESMPSSFVVDKKGVIRFVHIGYRQGDGLNFENEIKTILK